MSDLFQEKEVFNRGDLAGMAVMGVTGGTIGAFIGEGGLAWIGTVGLMGAMLGAVVWRMGGEQFFLLIVIGALLGGGLAYYVSGMESVLLGAATGGAMGGFIGVNFMLFRK